jgi:hypothetical protein
MPAFSAPDYRLFTDDSKVREVEGGPSLIVVLGLGKSEGDSHSLTKLKLLHYKKIGANGVPKVKQTLTFALPSRSHPY